MQKMLIHTVWLVVQKENLGGVRGILYLRVRCSRDKVHKYYYAKGFSTFGF
jgi:hypothetical protein